MTPQDEVRFEERALTAYLIRKVCDRAKGRAEDECLRNYPRDRYFIGSLRPFRPDDGVPGEDVADGERERWERSRCVTFHERTAAQAGSGRVRRGFPVG